MSNLKTVKTTIERVVGIGEYLANAKWRTGCRYTILLSGLQTHEKRFALFFGYT